MRTAMEDTMSDVASPPAKKYDTFAEFYPFYLSEHSDPQECWAEGSQAIDWYEPAKKVFDPDAGVYGRWFAGAVCNTCHNAIDRHVAAGRANQPALIYDSPVTSTKRVVTYADLLKEV